MASTKIETQLYKVVSKEKDFEIRLYESTTMATIRSSAKSYKEIASPGFRKLASYIFGGNKSNVSIAMTTPVHMDINDTLSTMSFVMPTEYNKYSLPEPNDSNVIINEVPAEYVAAIEFGGYASDEDIKAYSLKLEKALAAKSIKYRGNFRFLGYNAPYQFINRRNEIVVNVVWDF